jgi:hypothetical protein
MSFGDIRSCYINFAEHLLNAYNPNMTAPPDLYRWLDEDWRRFIDMIAGFGFNLFEFWLTPRLFSPSALDKPFAREFARQMNGIIEHARARGVGVKMLCILNTVGDDWHAHCPNDKEEWAELLSLWTVWLQRLPGLAVVGLFPGDPGGCSRNGCTARTFIDASLRLSQIIRRHQPGAAVEIGTWGPPFWGWGVMEGPPGWSGQFHQEYQHTGWRFDPARADDAMEYLLRRLPEFPPDTRVAINLAFNGDGNPDADGGAQDARPWARRIAQTHPIVTWDFSLTEGENAILPHYRFERLFAQRRREREAAPYAGGICYTMTPRLNQLSLFQAAQSFVQPDADPIQLTRQFLCGVLGPAAEPLAEALPLFEIIPDWGNYQRIDLARPEFHRIMRESAELLRSLTPRQSPWPFHPSPAEFQAELRFFFELFRDLSDQRPDFDELRQRYWQRVYAIYDHLPKHVDPRPREATDRLIGFFDPAADRSKLGAFPGKWLL